MKRVTHPSIPLTVSTGDSPPLILWFNITTPLEMIARDATVMKAAQRMREKDINMLVVQTTPWAIISSTDVLDTVAEGRDVSG